MRRSRCSNEFAVSADRGQSTRTPRPWRHGGDPEQLPLPTPVPKARPTVTVALAITVSAWTLFSGCGSTQAPYDKPGITQAERQQDMNECLRAAMGGTSKGWPPFGPYEIDREDYERCLAARGYAVTPTPSSGRREPIQAP